MDHEVASEVVVVAEASLHEGLQPLVLQAKVEEPTVKPVDPEKMARLEMQLHETDHLSKRGIMGTTTLDASCLFMTLFTCFVQTLRRLMFQLFKLLSHVCFHFITIASGYCSVRPDNACAFLWIHPSYCFSFLCVDGIFKAHHNQCFEL